MFQNIRWPVSCSIILSCTYFHKLSQSCLLSCSSHLIISLLSLPSRQWAGLGIIIHSLHTPWAWSFITCWIVAKWECKSISGPNKQASQTDATVWWYSGRNQFELSFKDTLSDQKAGLTYWGRYLKGSYNFWPSVSLESVLRDNNNLIRVFRVVHISQLISSVFGNLDNSKI